MFHKGITPWNIKIENPVLPVLECSELLNNIAPLLYNSTFGIFKELKQYPDNIIEQACLCLHKQGWETVFPTDNSTDEPTLYIYDPCNPPQSIKDLSSLVSALSFDKKFHYMAHLVVKKQEYFRLHNIKL